MGTTGRLRNIKRESRQTAEYTEVMNKPGRQFLRCILVLVQAWTKRSAGQGGWGVTRQGKVRGTCAQIRATNKPWGTVNNEPFHEGRNLASGEQSE